MSSAVLNGASQPLIAVPVYPTLPAFFLWGRTAGPSLVWNPVSNSALQQPFQCGGFLS